MTPHSPQAPRSAPFSSPWQGRLQLIGVLLVCLLSRAATTIHYIEDADSLRFALGILHYDVTRLQPQFPGYMAFVGVVKLLYAVTGRYALAFSLVGGLGLFVLLHYSLAILRWRFAERRGLMLGVLLVFNPMVWLLGNRYMSDLSGAACMLAAFYHLSRIDSRRHIATGFFLTGILAGWRLSYAPFLLPPLLLALFRGDQTRRSRGRYGGMLLLAGAAGVLVWLIPLVLVTGGHPLVETAWRQTGAHFLATGGTYVTENAWALRIQRLFAHVWADGLGAWTPGRHPVTLVVTGGALVFLLRGIISLRPFAGTLGTTTGRALWGRRTPAVALLAFSCGTYALWILFFQNVIHQTRHVLPLVPPLLMLLATGLSVPALSAARHRAFRVAALLFFVAYAFTGVTLARQHMRPAAIAQAKAFVETFVDPATVIVAAPWIEKYLSAQGVTARFLSVDTPDEVAALPARLRALAPTASFAAVGDYSDVLASTARPVVAHRTFYHNPYVNRLGARIDVFVYGPPAPATPAAAPAGEAP